MSIAKPLPLILEGQREHMKASRLDGAAMLLARHDEKLRVVSGNRDQALPLVHHQKAVAPRRSECESQGGVPDEILDLRFVQ